MTQGAASPRRFDSRRFNNGARWRCATSWSISIIKSRRGAYSPTLAGGLVPGNIDYQLTKMTLLGRRECKASGKIDQRTLPGLVGGFFSKVDICPTQFCDARMSHLFGVHYAFEDSTAEQGEFIKRTSHRLSHTAIGVLVARATRRVHAHSQVVRRMGYQRFLPLTVIAGLMGGCGGRFVADLGSTATDRSEYLAHLDVGLPHWVNCSKCAALAPPVRGKGSSHKASTAREDYLLSA
jgi:hypothetical protein